MTGAGFPRPLPSPRRGPAPGRRPGPGPGPGLATHRGRRAAGSTPPLAPPPGRGSLGTAGEGPGEAVGPPRAASLRPGGAGQGRAGPGREGGGRWWRWSRAGVARSARPPRVGLGGRGGVSVSRGRVATAAAEAVAQRRPGQPGGVSTCFHLFRAPAFVRIAENNRKTNVKETRILDFVGRLRMNPERFFPFRYYGQPAFYCIQQLLCLGLDV